ncbi:MULTISPECIES: amphi-Trp domain-containing protein [Natronosalvus]|uniref:Amphi-Trp domain-containing protein n=1 Tax=Natronosalvus rutilus TaxID=2953753 RepID=A0A9E7NAH8_9EURY|nr:MULTISPECIES: amphi-Trp domain-containing protein [Natronosalvus]UTF54450.1 amphi-Trp domain-containing protein [Natronosalvus rutilus]
MADTTTYKDELTREEVADRLQELAREIRSGGDANISVGNKVVTLSPDAQVTYDLEVEERSPMLGGRREEIDLTLAWGVKKEKE